MGETWLYRMRGTRRHRCTHSRRKRTIVQSAPPCPHCSSREVIKRGQREVRSGKRQIWFCSACRRRFSQAPIPGATYHAKAVLYAPVAYYQGFSLRAVVSRIAARYKVHPTLSSVSRWVKRFGKLAAVKGERTAIARQYPAGQVIGRRLFRHRQNYLMQVHRYKLDALPDAMTPLRAYLEALLAGTVEPGQDDLQLRGSATRLDYRVPALRSERTYACTAAELALKAAERNTERHASIQAFLLALDRATVAVEVPVWLTPAETRGILGLEGGLLGHMDFLQVYGNTVCVLDYKPDAAAQKHVHEQLLIYAIALSRRTGIHLRHMRCSWFDEKNCFSFGALPAYVAMRAAVVAGRGVVRAALDT